MRLRDILSIKGSETVKVLKSHTLAEAIAVMTSKGVGSALVVDNNNEIAGIVTERDVLRFCSRNPSELDKTNVKSIMTSDLIVGIPDDDVETMIATMVENRFRHLPVLENGKLVGLVSMGDLVKSQLSAVKVENRYLKDYISGSYPR